MKTIEKTKKWLLKNRVDKYGNLDLSCLDFSDFEGDIKICNMKVQKNLFQRYQEVQGFLFQGHQKVEKNLCQNMQEVKGYFITQTLQKDEEYKIEESGYTYIVKKTKKGEI